METKVDEITLKRCAERCVWNVKAIKSLTMILDINAAETDIEKIDAILKATDHIERYCRNVRNAVEEYRKNGGAAV